MGSLIFMYAIVAYGACNVIAYGDGPFSIFARIRSWAYNFGEHFAKLFTCMMCLPANFGLIASLVSVFLTPIPFTPFSIMFVGHYNLWYLIALCDGAFTTGIVYAIHIIVEYLEHKIDYYEQNTTRDETNIEGYDPAESDGGTLLVEDITTVAHEGTDE